MTSLKDKLLKGAKEIGEKVHSKATEYSGVGLAFLAENKLLKHFEKLTKSTADKYDKALDSEYLKSHIAGGDHRLFDGGHDVFSAWDKVKNAMPDDSFGEEVLGYVSALWKDVTTSKGLPFVTVSKESFDSWVETATAWIPGVDRKYLYDLLSFDAMEILSTGLGAIGTVFALKREDKEKLAELLGSMGIVSILSANPIMGIFVIATTGYAYKKKQMELNKVTMAKAATVTTLSVALFSILGLPILFELVLIGVLTKVFRKEVLDNEKFHQFIKDNIVETSKKKTSEISDFIKQKFSPEPEQE